MREILIMEATAALYSACEMLQGVARLAGSEEVYEAWMMLADQAYELAREARTQEVG